MSKAGKVVTKATYGLLNLAMKPLYDQMRKETKLFNERWDAIYDRASQDAEAEKRLFQVHQMDDPIVNRRSIW